MKNCPQSLKKNPYGLQYLYFQSNFEESQTSCLAFPLSYLEFFIRILLDRIYGGEVFIQLFGPVAGRPNMQPDMTCRRMTANIYITWLSLICVDRIQFNFEINFRIKLGVEVKEILMHYSTNFDLTVKLICRIVHIFSIELYTIYL